MRLRELIVIVVLIEALLHYFPWRMLIKRELPRLAAYVLGLLGMMVPFSAWLMDQGAIETIQTLWTVIGSAGLTVFGLYGLDRHLDLAKRDQEAKQREGAMTVLLRETGNASE